MRMDAPRRREFEILPNVRANRSAKADAAIRSEPSRQITPARRAVSRDLALDLAIVTS
jgi:hypothetical protein